MYENAGRRHSIDREKLIPKAALPKFGKEANTFGIQKSHPGDGTKWNVPRVGKLRKTNFLNRPWLIRRERVPVN